MVAASSKRKTRARPPSGRSSAVVTRPGDGHPHQNFDRAVRAAVARLTGGVSPHAFIEAWSDWAQHLARSPGRQMELAEHAQRNLLKLMALATRSRCRTALRTKAL